LHKISGEFAENFFNGRMIECDKAPEPEEIIWENLNCNIAQKKHHFALFFMGILLISFTTACTYFAHVYLPS